MAFFLLSYIPGGILIDFNADRIDNVDKLLLQCHVSTDINKFMIKNVKNKNGFTLIELLIVISIFSLLVFALPNFGRIIQDQRLKGYARDIYSNMQKAKMQAIKDNTNVVIDFNPGAYDPDGGVGSYQVFIDNGAGAGTAGNFVRDGSEPLVTSIAMPKNVSMTNAGFSGGTTITGFNSRGLPASSRIGNVQVRNSTRWYKITLSIAGTLRMEISSDGAAWSN